MSSSSSSSVVSSSAAAAAASCSKAAAEAALYNSRQDFNFDFLQEKSNRDKFEQCMTKLHAKIMHAHEEMKKRSPALLARCTVAHCNYLMGPFISFLNKAEANGAPQHIIDVLRSNIRKTVARHLREQETLDKHADPAELIQRYLVLVQILFHSTIPQDKLEVLRTKYSDQKYECTFRFIMLEDASNGNLRAFNFRKWVLFLDEEDRNQIYNMMRVWAVCGAILSFVPAKQLRALEKAMDCGGDLEKQQELDQRIITTLACLTMLFDNITMDNVLSTIRAILEMWVKDAAHRQLLSDECNSKIRPFLSENWEEYQELVKKTGNILAAKRNSNTQPRQRKSEGLLGILRDKCIVNIFGINYLVNRLACHFRPIDEAGTVFGKYKLESITAEQFTIVTRLADSLQEIVVQMIREHLEINWDLLKNPNVLSLFSFLASEVFHVQRDELETEIYDLGNGVKEDWSDIASDFMTILRSDDDEGVGRNEGRNE